jgi:hypothetical protein
LVSLFSIRIVELEIHRKAGNLKGVPAVPQVTVNPQIWSSDTINRLVAFIGAHPPSIAFSNVKLAIKGDSSREALIPIEWKDMCPIR